LNRVWFEARPENERWARSVSEGRNAGEPLGLKFSSEAVHQGNIETRGGQVRARGDKIIQKDTPIYSGRGSAKFFEVTETTRGNVVMR